jgi:hypothetical protein
MVVATQQLIIYTCVKQISLYHKLGGYNIVKKIIEKTAYFHIWLFHLAPDCCTRVQVEYLYANDRRFLFSGDVTTDANDIRLLHIWWRHTMLLEIIAGYALWCSGMHLFSGDNLSHPELSLL